MGYNKLWVRFQNVERLSGTSFTKNNCLTCRPWMIINKRDPTQYSLTAYTVSMNASLYPTEKGRLWLSSWRGRYKNVCRRHGNWSQWPEETKWKTTVQPTLGRGGGVVAGKKKKTNITACNSKQVDALFLAPWPAFGENLLSIPPTASFLSLNQ